MATIVTQQNNPWGVIAANLAGNLIQNLIQRGQEADQNRKYNALVNEVMNAGQAQNQGLLQSAATVPDGYNADPWAAALHKNYSPMTQYNIGTADITPFVQQNKTPSVQDIRNAVAANLGSKRFSMLDPAAVEKLMLPYYQQAEKTQQDALRKEYADKFMNAGNAADRRNIAWGGAIQDPSVVPFDFLQEAQRQYQYETPSATDIMNNDYRNRQFNEGVRQFNVNTAENARQFDATRSDNNYWRGVGQSNIEYERNNPGYSSIIQGVDGGQWAVDNQGNTRRLDTGESEFPRVSPFEQSQLKTAQSSIDSLTKRNDELRKHKLELLKIKQNNLQGEGNSDIDGEIKRVDEEIADNLLAIHKHENNISSINSTIQERMNAKIQDKDVTPAGFSGKISPRIANYEKEISNAASTHGVEPELIKAVIQAESAGNPNAVSKAGAQGLMQLMPGTAKNLGVKNPFDPEENINGGAKNLAQLIKQYGGDIEKALWAYNAGPDRVKQGIKPKETQGYIPKVMAIYNQLKSEKKANSTTSATGQTAQKTLEISNEDIEKWKEQGYSDEEINTIINGSGYSPVSKDSVNATPQNASPNASESGNDSGITSQDVNVFSDDKAPEISNEAKNTGQNAKIFPKKDFDYLVRRAKMGTLPYARNEQQVREYLAKQGYTIEE